MHNGSAPSHPVVAHSFEPADPWEVETPHGRGVVLYVTVYGAYANDLFCVANKEDGRIRHYQTDQISLTRNYTLQLNVPHSEDNAEQNGTKLTLTPLPQVLGTR
jgi:hypothetical protein